MPFSRYLRLAALVLAVVSASACSDPASPVLGTVVSLTIDSAGGPLVRTITVRMDRAAPAEVTYGAPDTPVLTIPADSFAVEHRLTLPRLRAAREYRVQAGVRQGLTSPMEARLRTGTLPPELAEIDLTVSGTPSLPVALVEVVGAPRTGGLLIVEEGEIVGEMDVTGGALFGMTRRDNGDIVLLDAEMGLVSRRLDGSLAHRLPQPGTGAPAAYGRIHHDVTATPRNTILFIANETQTVGGQPVVGEALWEWNPEAGSVVQRWSAFDHLEWPTLTGSRSNAGNWLHANGISFGPRGNVVMSLRNVDQVISIAPDFSRVEWRLGGVNGTLALGADDRFWGQHYVREPSRDRVLVYDNGFERSGQPYTRAIEFAIDAARGTATRVWQYRHAPDIYASLVGSAVRLPNGNTNVLFGMLAGQNGSTGPITAVEVTPSGTVQWRLTFGPQLTRVYRVTPVQSLLGEQPGAFR